MISMQYSNGYLENNQHISEMERLNLSKSFDNDDLIGLILSNSNMVCASAPILTIPKETEKRTRRARRSRTTFLQSYILPERLSRKLPEAISQQQSCPDFLQNVSIEMEKYCNKEFKNIQANNQCAKRWGDKCKAYPSACSFENYAKKNRYPDVLPPEFSRVRLAECFDDYINANNIQGLTNVHDEKYISAQAPTNSTIEGKKTLCKRIHKIFYL